MLSVALVGMVGVALCFGESLAARFGQTATGSQTEAAQGPNVSLGDLVGAAY